MKREKELLDRLKRGDPVEPGPYTAKVIEILVDGVKHDPIISIVSDCDCKRRRG